MCHFHLKQFCCDVLDAKYLFREQCNFLQQLHYVSDAHSDAMQFVLFVGQFDGELHAVKMWHQAFETSRQKNVCIKEITLT